MEESILKSTKKILGIAPADDSFDLDVITHINSSISTLMQVGVLANGFVTDENQEWDDIFDDDDQLPLIKTCVYLQTRLLFDPPTTSYLLAAAERQVQEHIWRLNVGQDIWTDPEAA